jgi:hypothetical protein
MKINEEKSKGGSPVVESSAMDTTTNGLKNGINKNEKLVAFRKPPRKISVIDPDKQKKDAFAGRMYAINAPKIFLETITARTTLIIIAVTYIVFIAGFITDIHTTYTSFNSSNYALSAYSCSNYGASVFTSGETWSCSSNNQWNSTVTNLNNVLSVKLSVQQSNLTNFFPSNVNRTFTITFNVKLWACFESDGCDNDFHLSDTYTSDPTVWQKVLFLTNVNLDINLRNDASKSDGGELTSILISNTFQNQESIPTNGLVKSYFIFVEYVTAPYNIYTAIEREYQPYISYSFDVVTRPTQPIADSLTVALMFLTLCVFCGYCYVISQSAKILSEQLWLIGYFILLILFQNPVYIVIVWFHNPPPSPGAAYGSYFITNLAQSGLFILWLLFADTLHRKTRNKLVFYGPKVLVGFLIFLFESLILTFQFPSISADNTRDSLAAVANWSTVMQVEFITFTFGYLFFFFVWAVAWFIRLFNTHRKLKRLPYMTTRYIQLSYRFFLLQATLVTVYYLFQYLFVIYYLSFSSADPTSLTDNINTVFRQQSQLFGKTLFLTVYAIILAFLFLPANLLDRTGLKMFLAATYVITEEEHKQVIKFRKDVIKSHHATLVVNPLVNVKIDVFCVDVALKLRNISFQAYYDLPTLKTVSGYEGAYIDLDIVGYDLVDNIYDKSHEVNCYILREKTAPFRLVIAFRGTASKKQMEDNLNYTKMKINFNHLNMYAIDLYDGLNFRETRKIIFLSLKM